MSIHWDDDTFDDDEKTELDILDEIDYGPDTDRDVRNSMFTHPGGNSALRAATDSNPRNLPCGNCGQPNRLTPADKALGYQCDTCADRDEMGF